MTSPSKIAVLFLLAALLHPWVAERAHAEEEALSPDFLEYLGTVEASGIKGIENLGLDELYQMLKKVFQDKDSRKKEDTGHKKEREHGDSPKN